MARPTYPRAGEPRPAALPPAERTVGQLVAESIRIYGERFRRALLIGIAPAVLVIVGAHVSKVLVLILAPTVTAALVSASYVGASVLVLDRRPSNRRLLVAWLLGWLVFIPAPFLVFAFVLPALAWLAAFGLVVPVLVAEDIAPRAAFGRAWQLARADFVHVLGSLATLAIVGLLTQGMLAFILRGSGGTALSTAFFLANVVISPLLFIGSALLYVDQIARLRAE
jgi:MFS family permease